MNWGDIHNIFPAAVLNSKTANKLRRKLFMKLLQTVGTCLLFLIASISTAHADHGDSTSAANDPIADLADLYTFVDPHCAGVNGI